MTKAVLGVIGGSGRLRPAGARGRARGAHRLALGRAVGRAAHRPHRRDRRSSSCRATGAATGCRRPSIDYRANIDVLKRAGVTDLVSVSACGSFKAELYPGPVRARRPVRRPHARARELVLRQRLRRPCLDGASGRAAAAGAHRRGGARPRASSVARGGTYVCMEGPQFSILAESLDLQGPRLRRDRHDRHAGGEARPRGRDHLRHRRHGDRLRLLAPRARRGRGRGDHQGADARTPARRPGSSRGSPATSRPSTRPARSAPTARSTPP